MPTSLAAQLQNIASLDADRLTSRYGVPSSKSYLFPAKVAESQDLDAVHALGQSGFDELVQLDPDMEEFEDELFSEAAKRTDRMMLNSEENAKLDKTLERCLRRLGRWIGIMAGGKCIEWLVRRFRVHEMNAETVLQVFLPYHDSPNFARILAIVLLPSSSPYAAPFAAFSKRAQPVPREYITNAVSSARDPSLRLMSDLVFSVQNAVSEGVVHRALLTFWTATLVDLLERSRTSTARVPEGVVKLLVEAFVTILSTPNTGAEVNAAVYPPLVLLVRTVRLADGPFTAIVEALLTPNTGANPSQRILTLLVLLDGRKGWQGLGQDAPARLAKIPQLGDLLIAAMDKYGFQNAMQAVVAALIEDVTVSQATLATLVDYPALPPAVVKLAASKLLETPSDGHDTARALLSTLRQRHPAVIDSAVLEASATAEVDPALVQWSSAESAFVDVHSADVASRASGVNEMYAVAKEAGLKPSNAAALLAEDDSEKLRSAQTAILARLRDTDDAVLAALYAEPALLLALLTGADYVDAVTPTFTASKPDHAAIGRHLGFIAAHYLPAHTEARRKVYDKLLVPNLLATEERRAFAPEHWPTVAKTSRLLERVNGDVALDASRDDLVKFNHGLVKSMAAAIAATGDIGARVDVLVSNLSSTSAHARLLATLTLAQLMSCAGGYQHVVAARALEELEKCLAGKQMRDVDTVEGPLSDALLKAVVHKPTGAKTQQRAQLALLCSAATVPASPNAPAWFDDTADAHALAHALYRWANSANLSAGVAKHLLHALFAQLGEDVLLFLASVWTGTADSATRVAALRHAAAFVKAYTHGAKATDFQLAIPATLVALQDSAKNVRTAAAVLLRAIAATPRSASADIYALETIYGGRSDLVQLLKPSDLAKYLGTLTGALDDMVIDAGRLALVHGDALDAQSKNGHKDTTHRRDVVDWLMSHILGWRADRPRRALLSSLTRAVNTSRLYGALPLLEPLADQTKDEGAWLAALPPAHRAEYLDLVFDAFNARHASAVTENDSEAWKFLLALLEKPGELRTLSLQRMADGLFSPLKPAQKAEYVVALLQSLHALEVGDKLASRAVLAKLSLSAAEIISVVETPVQPLESPVQRKKAKHDDADDRTEQAVVDLTVFIESRNWKALPGNAPLVAALMGVLAAVLTKRQTIKEGVDYLEQEVLGGILAQVEQIQDADAFQRTRIGIEVIVKVIRASTNPRTSQRALLVASELARLIPDAVLHNVMPIFTFMGSSDLQRDDAFSFGVVEKTVARIVPVMTASLKEKATTKPELYAESRAFLSIFTDMASRLPKHRTLPFFVHLAKSLGADDFLAPLCMLLADRNGKSKAAGLELPLALAAAFPAPIRTGVLVEVVREVSRLARGDDAAFLEADDRAHKLANTLLQLAAGIARGLGGKACPQPLVEEVVRDLVALSGDAELAEPLDAALASAMQLLSVDAFLSTVARILEAGSETDSSRALELFTTRLPLVRADLRAKSSAAIGTIVRLAAGLLGTVPRPALAALNAVVSSAIAGEDGALAAIVPTVVKATKAADAETAPFGLALVGHLVRRLGPRAIPHIQAILDLCLQSSADAAFGTLASLVDTVPTFISSKQLVALLRAAAEHRAADEGASATLIAAVAKRIPTKTLVPVVMDLWRALAAGPVSEATVEAFFALLKHALRQADRKALPGLTKPLFAFFLDVFDLRSSPKAAALSAPVVDAAERSATASFCELVTKLSDAAFKPLFSRLYDWAVVDLALPPSSPHVCARRATLLHVYEALLDRFRHLLTPYMATLLPFLDELLAAYAAGTLADEPLWSLALGVLAKSMDVDDGAFWTDSALLKLLPQLVAQLAVFPTSAASPTSPPATALAALAAACSSELTLKKVNTAVLLATRADEPLHRIAALRALDAMWARHADELIPLVPETVGEFLAELLEDENGDVEALARAVLARIEGVTGSLKEYLE